MNTTFNELASVATADKTEKKNGFTYLSWVYAWGEACKRYNVTRTVYKSATGCLYHTDGRTAWVEVGVTIEGVEHIDYLPIMDNRNQSIFLDKITSFDANKAIQRSTVKALALHGIGLNVYAGEDLPTIAALPSVAECKKWIEKGKRIGDVESYLLTTYGERAIELIAGLK